MSQEKLLLSMAEQHNVVNSTYGLGYEECGQILTDEWINDYEVMSYDDSSKGNIMNQSLTEASNGNTFDKCGQELTNDGKTSCSLTSYESNERDCNNQAVGSESVLGKVSTKIVEKFPGWGTDPRTPGIISEHCQKIIDGEVINPVENLSDEEIISLANSQPYMLPHPTRKIAIIAHLCRDCRRPVPHLYKCTKCSSFFCNAIIDKHELYECNKY